MVILGLVRSDGDGVVRDIRKIGKGGEDCEVS